jgi:phosphoadenosine phosphosulfate reductase
MSDLTLADITSQSVRSTEAALEDLNKKLVKLGPQQILEWAVWQFSPHLALACSFGGISCMTLLDMAVQLDPQIRVFYLDTGFLFPETYTLRDEVARRYGITPLAFRSELSPQAQATIYGDELWRHDPDKCCDIRKVAPNRQALSGMQAWITGLRRDQSNTRRQVRAVDWDNKFNLYKISPLWDWTAEMVWTYIQAEGIPYNPLHDKGYPSLGCTHCTQPVAEGQDSRAGRWSGTGKTECGLHR